LGDLLVGGRSSGGWRSHLDVVLMVLEEDKILTHLGIYLTNDDCSCINLDVLKEESVVCSADKL